LLLGAVLPLSGPLTPYGNQVLNGIKVALEQSSQFAPHPTIGLVTKDSESDQKQLVIELDDLLEDYRPVAVIGPLLTRSLKIIAPAADSRNIVFFTQTATYLEVLRLGRCRFCVPVNNCELCRSVSDKSIFQFGWK